MQNAEMIDRSRSLINHCAESAGRYRKISGCHTKGHACLMDENIRIYYIQSNKIQENIDEIYCIFYIFTSENINFYIFTPLECTYNLFGLPLTFPLTYCSALQNFKHL